MSPIEREHVEFVCPTQIEVAPLQLAFASAPIPARRLVGAPEEGNGAVIIDAPAGWTAGGARCEHAFELLVLDGEIEVDGRRLGQYGYLSTPAGARCPALVAPADARLFVDFIADVTESALIEWDEEGWRERPDDGNPAPAPGLMHRMLRGTHEGPRAFLLRIPPGWREERTEWHDCAEASIRLEGSLYSERFNDGAGGLMTRHCYFWRPKHGLHSPMRSDEGAFSMITVDGHLVNHYVEDEGLPPA